MAPRNPSIANSEKAIAAAANIGAAVENGGCFPPLLTVKKLVMHTTPARTSKPIASRIDRR